MTAGGRPVERLLRLAAVVPAVVAVLLANAVIGLNVGTVVAGGMVWVALTGLVKRFRDQRDTPAGAEAAAGWLGVRAYLGGNEVFPSLPPAAVAIWDRYLAYGAALGVAMAALRALPMGAEDDHRAWSSYGGRWRVVRVRYPRLRLAWTAAGAAFLVGLGVTGAGYLLLRLMLSLRGATGGAGEPAPGWVWWSRSWRWRPWRCRGGVVGRRCGRWWTWGPGGRWKARSCGCSRSSMVKLLARLHRRFDEAVPGVSDQAWLRGDTVAVVRGDVMVSIRLQGRRVPDRPDALSGWRRPRPSDSPPPPRRRPERPVCDPARTRPGGWPAPEG